jgi:hypothetical protein
MGRIRSWLDRRTGPEASAPAASTRIGGAPTLGRDHAELDVAEEVDPLEEARILLTYGRSRAAAKVLAWHVQAAPADDVAFTQLARLYLSLDEHAGFVTLVDTGFRQRRNTRLLRQCVAVALKRWPDDLNFTELAEQIGLQLPRRRPSKPHPRAVRQTPAASAAPPPVYGPPPAVPAVPTAARAEPETAADPVLPLVALLPPLGGLAAAERYALSALDSVSVLRRLHLGEGEDGLLQRFLHNAIAREPGNFRHYVDLLLYLSERRDQENFARALWRLFWVLGEREPRLRSDLLQVGEHMGTHPLIVGLRGVQDGRKRLDELGDELGLLPLVGAEGDGRTLVEARDHSHPDTSAADRSAQREILETVRGLLSLGEADKAMWILEETLVKDPTRHALYPILFSLYEIRQAFDRFRHFELKILGAKDQPPLETVLKILDTSKKLQRLAEPRRAKSA